MKVPEQRLEDLLRQAPKSTRDLFRLLTEGLGWPTPGDLEPDQILWDWAPEELHLDPEKLAKLQSVQQIPPLVHGQKFGVFLLNFAGDHLPIGAIRRLVSKLARKANAKSNPAGHAVWDLDDLLFFCQTSGRKASLHVVALRDIDGRRVLRTLSWDTDTTTTRMSLLAERAVPDLRWQSTGPAITRVRSSTRTPASGPRTDRSGAGAQRRGSAGPIASRATTGVAASARPWGWAAHCAAGRRAEAEAL